MVHFMCLWSMLGSVVSVDIIDRMTDALSGESLAKLPFTDIPSMTFVNILPVDIEHLESSSEFLTTRTTTTTTRPHHLILRPGCLHRDCFTSLSNFTHRRSRRVYFPLKYLEAKTYFG